MMDAKLYKEFENQMMDHYHKWLEWEMGAYSRYKKKFKEKSNIDKKWDMKEKIEQIMENFDFDKVHRVMAFLDLDSSRGDSGMPSVEVLKEKARELLSSVDEKTVAISAGGFEAKYYSGYLSLSFIVEEWGE